MAVGIERHRELLALDLVAGARQSTGTPIKSQVRAPIARLIGHSEPTLLERWLWRC